MHAPPTQTCCAWSGANTRQVKWNTINRNWIAGEKWTKIWSEKMCLLSLMHDLVIFSQDYTDICPPPAISGAFSIWNWDGWDVSLPLEGRWAMCMRLTLCAKGPGFIFCLLHACMIIHTLYVHYLQAPQALQLYTTRCLTLCVCLPFSKAFLTAIMACCAARCSLCLVLTLGMRCPGFKFHTWSKAVW